MSEALWQKSAVELAAGIRERQFSCSDVMSSVVDRILALNPKLNAIVNDLYSYGINYLGLPAGVMPIDLVEHLPAGVQLVGRRFREDVILDAMSAIEQRTGCFVNQLWAR